MSVTLSAHGTRIDCDNCGQHAFSPDLTTEQLRAATGYARADGTHGWDLCPECAAELLIGDDRATGQAERPDRRAPRPGDRPRQPPFA